MEEERVRLFVGGLASGVSAGDLKDRFTPLGKVLSIALPQSKVGVGHRGFAYVDFVPATDASLRKLFSAYNGCKWRGGCLRIEKAKELYLDRLNREWATETASSRSSAEHPPEVQGDQQSIKPDGRQTGEYRSMNGDSLNLFFPKLRKVKAIPMDGLGKHKRSFQRVESSPLHLLLSCTCNLNSCSGLCDTRKADYESRSLNVERPSEVDILRASSDAEESKLELPARLAVGKGIKQGGEENRTIFNREGSTQHIDIVATLNSPANGRIKSPSQQSREVVGFSGKDEETSDIGAKEDSTKESVAKERVHQLQLMNRLFPEDVATISEGIQVVPPERARVKKRNRAMLENSLDLVDPSPDNSKRRITHHSKGADQQPKIVTKTDEQMKFENIMFGKSPVFRVEQTSPKHDGLPVTGSDKLSADGKTTGGEGDSSIRLYEAEINGEGLQGPMTVSADDPSEEDLDMVLNFGDESVSLAVAEDREKRMVKGIRDVENDSMREDAVGSNERIPWRESDQEDSDMVLNFGDDSASLGVAEVQEKRMVKGIRDVENESMRRDGVKGSNERIPGRESDQEQMSSRGNPSKCDVERPSPVTAAGNGGEPCRIQVQKASAGSQVGHRVEPSNTRAKKTRPTSAIHEANVDSNVDSGGPGPTLTRSAWKNLVGETGHVVFSLRDLTGSGEGPLVASPAQESPSMFNDSQDQSRTVTISKNQLKADVRSQNNPGEISKNPAIPSLPSDDICLFMRSENAEKEWLASKSELRTDYRAKHRQASRTMKKLWGRKGS